MEQLHTRRGQGVLSCFDDKNIGQCRSISVNSVMAGDNGVNLDLVSIKILLSRINNMMFYNILLHYNMGNRFIQVKEIKKYWKRNRIWKEENATNLAVVACWLSTIFENFRLGLNKHMNCGIILKIIVLLLEEQYWIRRCDDVECNTRDDARDRASCSGVIVGQKFVEQIRTGFARSPCNSGSQHYDEETKNWSQRQKTPRKTCPFNERSEETVARNDAKVQQAMTDKLSWVSWSHCSRW